MYDVQIKWKLLLQKVVANHSDEANEASQFVHTFPLSLFIY